jgi:hypothetical protein
LRKVLQNLNLLCDEAENGQVAVDLHRQGKTYDLVLMDKEMPVMDGHQVSEELSTVFFWVYTIRLMLLGGDIWRWGYYCSPLSFLNLAGYKAVTDDGSENTYYCSDWECNAI